jgi:hypothetical protein
VIIPISDICAILIGPDRVSFILGELPSSADQADEEAAGVAQ